MKQKYINVVPRNEVLDEFRPPTSFAQSNNVSRGGGRKSYRTAEPSDDELRFREDVLELVHERNAASLAAVLRVGAVETPAGRLDALLDDLLVGRRVPAVADVKLVEGDLRVVGRVRFDNLLQPQALS